MRQYWSSTDGITIVPAAQALCPAAQGIALFPSVVPKRTNSPFTVSTERRPSTRLSSARSRASARSSSTCTGCRSAREANAATRRPSVRSISMA